jgi:hypothetical protein
MLRGHFPTIGTVAWDNILESAFVLYVHSWLSLAINTHCSHPDIQTAILEGRSQALGVAQATVTISRLFQSRVIAKICDFSEWHQGTATSGPALSILEYSTDNNYGKSLSCIGNSGACSK